jgi:hypothetical protein
MISAMQGYNHYTWNTGESTQSIYAKQAGFYSVTVIDSNTCVGSDNLLVGIITDRITQNDTSICFGDSLTLTSRAATTDFADLTVPAGSTITVDQTKSAVQGTAMAGQNRIELQNPSGFKQGDLILVLTVVSSSNAGNYEYRRIHSIQGNTLFLDSTLHHDYASNTNEKSQVLKVPFYRNINLAGTLTCQPWDGSTGGVLSLYADNIIFSGSGEISATGKGFRGGPTVQGWGGGYQGESYTGLGGRTYLPNYGGGGGGNAEWCHSGQGGGGGGYLNNGAYAPTPCFSCGGGSWSFGSCSYSGFGGNLINITNRLILGSGGGSGGIDGDNPDGGGYGGNGGGIVAVYANRMSGNVTITSNGA